MFCYTSNENKMKDMFLFVHRWKATQSVRTWHDYPWKSCTAVIHDVITGFWHDYCVWRKLGWRSVLICLVSALDSGAIKKKRGGIIFTKQLYFQVIIILIWEQTVRVLVFICLLIHLRYLLLYFNLLKELIKCRE